MSIPAQTIIAAAAPVFLLLGIGFGLRKLTVLSQEADKTLMKLVVTVFYPCLFLDFAIGNRALLEIGNVMLAPTVGFLTTSIGFLVAWLIARSIGLEKGKGLRTFSFCSGIYNYGYIPIPLIAALFGDRETAGVLLVHNVGVELAIWSIGIILLGGSFSLGSLKKLINPPIVALLIAMSLNFSGWYSVIPSWGMESIRMLANCAIPLGLVLAGASICDLMKEGELFSSFKVPVASIAVRLGILPILFLLVAANLDYASVELKRVMVIQAAMPAGIFPIVLSRHYGGEVKVAVQVVLATTLACVVTMPLWIGVGLSWVF